MAAISPAVTLITLSLEAADVGSRIRAVHILICEFDLEQKKTKKINYFEKSNKNKNKFPKQIKKLNKLH